MIIRKPSFEFIDERDPLKKIEICGRVCYKSENKITDSSAETFVKNLIKRGHESVLEHANIILKVSDMAYTEEIIKYITTRGKRCFLRMSKYNHRYIISGNVRAWRDFFRNCPYLEQHPHYFTLFHGTLFDDVNPEKNRPRDIINAYFISLSELLPEERLIHQTETVRFVVDRGISHEIVRHRTDSFSQESTRYCNYGGNIEFIMPPDMTDKRFNVWSAAMLEAEAAYNMMLSNGAKPQEARAVLPNSTKTEIIMTATLKDWEHFFELRTSEKAHPQMREIAVPLYEKMSGRNGVIMS